MVDRNDRALAEVFARHLMMPQRSNPATAYPEPRHIGGPAAHAESTPAVGQGRVDLSLLSLRGVLRVLEDVGFQPELAPDGTAIRLRRCPFTGLAREPHGQQAHGCRTGSDREGPSGAGQPVAHRRRSETSPM